MRPFCCARPRDLTHRSLAGHAKLRFLMESLDNVAFRLGDEGATAIAVSHACRPMTVFQKYGPDADSTRHLFRVHVSVPRVYDDFTAALTFETSLSDLRHFRDVIEAMAQTLKGIAMFNSSDGELALKGSISKTGNIVWDATLRCIDLDQDNVLNFRMGGDQSYLPALIKRVDALLEEARTEASVHENGIDASGHG